MKKCHGSSAIPILILLKIVYVSHSNPAYYLLELNSVGLGAKVSAYVLIHSQENMLTKGVLNEYSSCVNTVKDEFGKWCQCPLLESVQGNQAKKQRNLQETTMIMGYNRSASFS